MNAHAGFVAVLDRHAQVQKDDIIHPLLASQEWLFICHDIVQRFLSIARLVNELDKVEILQGVRNDAKLKGVVVGYQKSEFSVLVLTESDLTELYIFVEIV